MRSQPNLFVVVVDVVIVKTTTQINLRWIWHKNNIVHHHHHPSSQYRELHVSNILAITDPILTKLNL